MIQITFENLPWVFAPKLFSRVDKDLLNRFQLVPVGRLFR
jgi:hypothetical protein